MKRYAGLDVSLKEVSICVDNGDGGVLARGVVPTDPFLPLSTFPFRIICIGGFGHNAEADHRSAA